MPYDLTVRRTRLAAYALAVTVFFVVGERLVLNPFLKDPRPFPKYLALADRIIAGDVPRERLNDVSPAYLAAVVWLKGAGIKAPGIRALQITTLGAVALLVAAAAWQVAGAAAGWAAAATILGSQAPFINATEFEPETLILLVNAASIFFFVIRTSAGAHFLSGLFIGASVATRPSALIPLVLLAVCAAYRAERARRMRTVGSYLAGAALPLIAVLAVMHAFTGRAMIMNPGTVFFEGMNPLAMGYATAEPLVVADLQATIEEPDPLHAAYRLTASRAAARPLTVEQTNRLWTEKALQFVREHPMSAARLAMTKIFLALHTYDAWDLAPLVHRARDTENRLWIPFGAVVALALIGAALTRERTTALMLACFALSYVAILVLFYVTSRQRNGVFPAVAVLAGVGVARLGEFVASHQLRLAALLIGFVGASTLLLGKHYGWQAEDSHGWTASFQSETLVFAAKRAERAGDHLAAAELRALDGTWLLGDDLHIPSTPGVFLARAARGELAGARSDQRMFDIALGLLKGGDAEAAEKVLAHLDAIGYRPKRKLSATGSISYYRAVARLRTDRRAQAVELLRRARGAAPADANVLALSSLLEGDRRHADRLFALHDSFTARMALARAEIELRRPESAIATLGVIGEQMPEWSRPRLLRDHLRDQLAHRQ